MPKLRSDDVMTNAEAPGLLDKIRDELAEHCAECQKVDCADCSYKLKWKGGKMHKLIEYDRIKAWLDDHYDYEEFSVGLRRKK